MSKKAIISGKAEPIRTGRGLGERNPAGKLYAVDPQAVARLKAYVAEKEKLREQEEQPEKGDIISNILRTQHERQAALNARKRKPEIAADRARQWHIEFYQAGFSLAAVAEMAGVSRQRLTRRWKELGLPISRKLEERFWRPEDENE